MSDDDLRELLKHEAKATPGPWRNTIRRENAKAVARAIMDSSSGCSESIVKTVETPQVQDVICWMGPGANQEDDILDARLIVLARNALRPLVEEVLRLRAELERLHAAPVAEPVQATTPGERAKAVAEELHRMLFKPRGGNLP